MKIHALIVVPHSPGCTSLSSNNAQYLNQPLLYSLIHIVLHTPNTLSGRGYGGSVSRRQEMVALAPPDNVAALAGTANNIEEL